MPDAKAEVAKFLDWKRERDAAMQAMSPYTPGPPDHTVWPPQLTRRAEAEWTYTGQFALARVYLLIRGMREFSREDILRYEGVKLRSETLRQWLEWGRVERLPSYENDNGEIFYRWVDE